MIPIIKKKTQYKYFSFENSLNPLLNIKKFFSKIKEKIYVDYDLPLYNRNPVRKIIYILPFDSRKIYIKESIKRKRKRN